MKRILLTLALLIAVPCFAQTGVSTSGMPIPAAASPQAATAPVSTPVVASCSVANVGVEYAHFSNGMSGTMEEATHPLTSCAKKYILSLGFAMIQVPAANTSFYLIGPRVDIPLAAIFPKIDPAFSSLIIYGGAGLGTAQVSPPNVAQTNHFSFGAHGGVAISPGSLFGVSTQFGVEGGVVGYNGNVFRATVLPNAAGQIAALVTFNIGPNQTTSAAQAKANAPVAPAK